MKLSDYDEHLRGPIKDYFVQALGFYKQEELMFVQSFYRMLIVANGSAIFLLSAYLGALVSANSSTDGFAFPMFLFFVGLIAAGFIVQYSLGVAHTAVMNVSDQVMRIFRDELDVEKFQGWGFSKKGLVVVGSAQIISAGCFLLGVIIVLIRL